jgi:hypothetical protein
MKESEEQVYLWQLEGTSPIFGVFSVTMIFLHFFYYILPSDLQNQLIMSGELPSGLLTVTNGTV